MTSIDTEAAELTDESAQRAPTSAEVALLWARLAAGALCVLAGIVHILYAPAHFDEGADVGLFFVAVGVDQIVVGVFLMVGAVVAPLVGATLLGTLAVLAIYVASRTTGLPFGSEPGVPEEVGMLDLITALFEAGVVALLGVVLVGRLAERGDGAGMAADERE